MQIVFFIIVSPAAFYAFCQFQSTIFTYRFFLPPEDEDDFLDEVVAFGVDDLLPDELFTDLVELELLDEELFEEELLEPELTLPFEELGDFDDFGCTALVLLLFPELLPLFFW